MDTCRNQGVLTQNPVSTSSSTTPWARSETAVIPPGLDLVTIRTSCTHLTLVIEGKLLDSPLDFGAGFGVSSDVPCKFSNSSLSSLENNRKTLTFSSKLRAANLAIGDGSGVLNSVVVAGAGAVEFDETLGEVLRSVFFLLADMVIPKRTDSQQEPSDELRFAELPAASNGKPLTAPCFVFRSRLRA